MLDVTRYTALKVAGAVALVRLGAAFAYSLKRFDPATGAILDPEIGAIDIAELNKARAGLLENVKSYDALIADLRALP